MESEQRALHASKCFIVCHERALKSIVCLVFHELINAGHVKEGFTSALLTSRKMLDEESVKQGFDNFGSRAGTPCERKPIVEGSSRYRGGSTVTDSLVEALQEQSNEWCG
jgi:hypothetical protein